MDRASAPVVTPLSARGLVGVPVWVPNGVGGEDRAGEVREVYLTPDRKRLAGLALWRADNVPGGGELLYLEESAIREMTADAIHLFGWDSLREFSLEERAEMTPRRIEMLRGYPLGADRSEAQAVDCLIEPTIRCVLGCTCGGRPATLLPAPGSDA
jgi:hypothetical protein